jgi:DNA-binding HxlR family transcriptional regulator
MGNRRARSGGDSAAALIGRRWAMMIVRQLSSGPQRFNELKAALPSISSKTLSLNLKQLESERVALRRVVGTKPLRVEYSLTDKGRALTEVLQSIESWGERWMRVEG